jgi:hypothetical protein
MKKQLFSIDISHYKGKTLVTWWRGDNADGDNCFQHIIPVKTESTYDRLFRLLPPENAGTCFVHPRSNDLSISWLLGEK